MLIANSIFAILLFLANVFADCPLNSIPSHNAGDNFCFQLIQAELEFVQAERVCNDLNGDLVSICDAFTNEQLRNAASKSFLQYDDKDFWLGLMNNGTNIWNWTNPSINCPYRNWANGEPNGSGSCASVSVSNGQWSSSDCTVTKPFICSVPKETPKVDKCPYGYVYFDKTGFCYKKIFNRTFYQAVDDCILDAEGAKLVSIHSDEENEFLISFCSIGYNVDIGGTTWIGLSRYNNVWGWVDGSNFHYTSNLGFGNSYNYTCAHLWSDQASGGTQWEFTGSWDNGYDCALSMRAAVCKMRPPN